MGPRRSGLQVSLSFSCVQKRQLQARPHLVLHCPGPTGRPSPERGSQLGPTRSPSPPVRSGAGAEREGGVRVQLRSGRAGGVPAAGRSRNRRDDVSFTGRQRRREGGRRGSQATPDALTSPGRPTSPARGGRRRRAGAAGDASAGTRRAGPAGGADPGPGPAAGRHLPSRPRIRQCGRGAAGALPPPSSSPRPARGATHNTRRKRKWLLEAGGPEPVAAAAAEGGSRR